MEQAIATTKAKRTTAKAKLTSIATQLSKPMKTADLQRLYEQLENAHTNFLELHYEYSEYVMSDEQFTEQRTVSGLNLDDYLAQAEETYSKAIKLYITAMSKPLIRDANLAIKKSVDILSQSDKISPDQYYEFSNVVANHVGVCKELCSHFNTFENEDTNHLISQLEDCVLKLDGIHIRRMTTSDPSKSVHFAISNNSGTNNSASQTNTSHHSSSSISASHDDVAGSGGGGSPVSHRPAPHESTRLSHGVRGGHQKSQSGRQSHPYIPQPLTEDISIVSIYSDQTGQEPVSDSDSNDTTQPRFKHNSSRFKFDKSPLPTFGGDRKQYSDFRSIWQSFAEDEFRSCSERAWALKRCLNGDALSCIDAITISQPWAYQRMWQRLDAKYLDVSLNIQSIYADLQRLSSVKEDDLGSLVQFVNRVESCYSRLGEVGQLNYITMPQIDDLNDLLPPLFRWEWMEKHREASVEDQLYPFSAFMSFLEKKRDIAMRFAERAGTTSKPGVKSKKVNSHAGNATPEASADSKNESKSGQSKPVTCVLHPESKHPLIECRQFIKMAIDEKYDILKANHFCYRCISKHARYKCKAKGCKTCRKDNHHHLLCRQGQSDVKTNQSHTESNKSSSQTHSTQAVSEETVSALSSHVHSATSLLPIHDVPVFRSSTLLTIFHDGGSNVSFITHQAAETCKAKRVCKAKVDLTVTGNFESRYDTYLYKVTLKSKSGEPVIIYVYGLPEITGHTGKLDRQVISRLFPGVNFNLLRRGDHVDILIGSDYCGLHPRKEVALAGKNLYILEGPLGLCIQGAHQQLKTGSKMLTQSACAVITHETPTDTTSPLHTEFVTPSVHFSKVEVSKACKFIEGETLGTEITVKCGSCKCGKCPVPGSTYSFTEEQELRMIRENLKFDTDNGCWRTAYPWTKDPHLLPDNYRSALATLCNTEKKLKQDPMWAKIYTEQIYDMVDRQVARKLTPEEISAWTGPLFYISHLAVLNPKSQSTPVRIVFNSSQNFQGVSLNGCLAKGPDAYINSILGVILRWREEQVALVGDIRKMYNSIHINPTEQHCHRFLWRDLETREPDIYAITRVNMGDRPAAAISAEAIYMTADMNADIFPDVTQLLKTSTYVDDIVFSVSDKKKAMELTRSTTKVLSSAGFTIKHWLFSEESEPRKSLDDPPSCSNPDYRTQVLGIYWEPIGDSIVTEVRLNFSPKRKGVYTGNDLTFEQIPAGIPEILTRRQVLEQTTKLYDPLGIYCAFTLTAKILLRETWKLELGWDDPLPQKLRQQWISHFSDLYKLADWKYNRSLTLPNAVGNPTLINL